MSLFDVNKVAAMVTDQVELAMAPLTAELVEIKDLLARLVKIEEGRESPIKARRAS